MKKVIGIILGVCFGSAQAMAAATCTDQAVIDAFLDRYVCSTGGEGAILNCSKQNISNYRELKSLSDEEIRRHVVPRISEDFRAIDNSVARKFADYYDDIFTRSWIAAKTLIRSINTIAEDYNPSIKRYTCQANLEFDADSLNDVSLWYGWLALLSDDELSGSLFMFLRIADSSLVDTHKVQAQKRSRNFLRRIRTTVLFTVQPRDLNAWFTSDFVVGFDPKNVIELD